ncbi:CASP-like protein 1 [Actinidia eriantha]|uniref:CASP-like protein 1 n=1 Tax=Actinidia eriantha TaxID=165200 RepID=UPI002585EE62|nr:CASP-like protein 1 [Actinidia eriantha]
MASTDTPAPEPEKTAPPPEASAPAEPEKAEVLAPEAPPPESKVTAATPPPDYLVVADLVLRVLLFALAVAAVVVMVTSEQTKLIPLPFPPFGSTRPAKFTHSPAFIYFVAALSVAGLYSILTTAVSFLALLKPGCSTKLLAHVVISDVLILGIVASATGAAGGVAYIGLEGNSHVGWMKICNVYDKFCRHLGAAIIVSLFASVVLVLLVVLSAYSLSKKIPQ